MWVIMYTFEPLPMKGVRCFGIKGKLAPRCISLYPIINKYGPTSYQVELPAKLSGVHNVFHVSQLKRCLKPLIDVVIEGPEKATRGGVNGSQSKFLVGTWPISQIEPDAPLF
jgi:hypothetical protein